MRIFFICQRVPFPPDRGDKITTFHELRHLASGHEVHVFCLADGVGDLANVAGAREFAESVTAVAVRPGAARLRAGLALLGGGSITVAMLREPELQAAIRRRYAELRPELILVYSSNVAQYAEGFPETPRIMQFADLDSAKFTRYAQSGRAPMRWLYGIEGRRLLAYERRIAGSFAHSLVCTDAELQDFRRLIPGVAVSTVGNGVDLGYFRSAGLAKTRGAMVFTGVMDYLPNVDAVIWFCEAILPLIQARLAHASFVICGSRPSPAVLRLAALPGVTVTGRVEDIRPYLDRAELFVAPLRISRGIQNKVIEALGMQLAVVSTGPTRVATGLGDDDGILAADTAEDFAGQVVRLLEDDAWRLALGERGRRAVERDFSWERQFAELDKVIAVVTE